MDENTSKMLGYMDAKKILNPTNNIPPSSINKEKKISQKHTLTFQEAYLRPTTPCIRTPLKDRFNFVAKKHQLPIYDRFLDTS